MHTVFWVTGLAGVNLFLANFAGAFMQDAYLTSTCLKLANFTGADLQYANIRDTDLRWADLEGADLRLANLADIKSADSAGFTGAIMRNTESLSGAAQAPCPPP